MSLNTAAKRRSSLAPLGLALVLPAPDSSVALSDRADLAYFYGPLASITVVLPPGPPVTISSGLGGVIADDFGGVSIALSFGGVRTVETDIMGDRP